MIEPKIIHYCWFGGKPFPKKIKKCIKSWKHFFPDFQFMLWDENSFDIDSSCKFVKDAYACKKWAFVADYVRFYALFHYGGIYMDTDVLVLKDFRGFVKMPFMCFGQDNDVAPGLITGCNKGDCVCKDIMSIYETMSFNPNNIITVNKIVTGYFVKRGLNADDYYQEVDGYSFYESKFFDPVDYVNRITEITDDTFTVHLYLASWVPRKIKFKRKIVIMVERIVGSERANGLFVLLKRIKDAIINNNIEPRIGIVTFHRALNYGAQLQCYALVKCLSNNTNNKVEIIDYYPIPSNKVSIFSNIIRFFRGNLKIKKLKDFPKKYLPLSKKYKREQDIDYSRYKTVIVGSDQVWSAQIIGNNTDFYSLSNYNGYKFSYAASFKGELSENIKAKIKCLNRVSIREKSNLFFFDGFNNISVVMDPVFLLNKDEWSKFSNPLVLPKQFRKYILFLNLSFSNELFEYAGIIKKEKNIPIISLNIFDSVQRIDDYRISRKKNIGPREFLWLIMNSQCVITDSFHATAFSIIFHKKCYVLTNKDDKRIIDLLDIVGVDNPNFIHKCENDFDTTKLNNLIIKSKNYIEECINDGNKCM